MNMLDQTELDAAIETMRLLGCAAVHAGELSNILEHLVGECHPISLISSQARIGWGELSRVQIILTRMARHVDLEKLLANTVQTHDALSAGIKDITDQGERK